MGIKSLFSTFSRASALLATLYVINLSGVLFQTPFFIFYSDRE